jgi:NAD(P)-dependent dehydrogenase (short-subunit alcohol dehydrogenase family)
MIDFGLQGRVLYVTGGGSGIGRAIATLGARGGMKVAVADAVGERAADVAARAEEMSDEVWLRCLDVNLTGMFRSVQPVGRGMVKRGRGAIVTISSVDGLGAHAGRSHYSASKHGVIGLTRALAIEWGRHGVRVNSIAPGVVDTPLVRANLPADHVQYAMVDRVPMGRLSSAEEQAGPTLFLLSDAAAFVNGAILPVDGGTSSGYFTRWNGADLGSRTLLEAGVYGEPAVTR